MKNVVDPLQPLSPEEASYRGLNAIMHTFEAYLTIGDVLGRSRVFPTLWSIAKKVISLAKEFDGFLPEHFHQDWTPDFTYHQSEPFDQFRPYGFTPGHGFEWAKLLLTFVTQYSPHEFPQFPETERSAWYEIILHLFNQNEKAAFDFRPNSPYPFRGYCYTLDYTHQPLMKDKLHWVNAEVISTAWFLYQVTGTNSYLEIVNQAIRYFFRVFTDGVEGSYIHQVDQHDCPVTDLWPGRPDVYHASQMLLYVNLPVDCSFSVGLDRQLHPTLVIGEILIDQINGQELCRRVGGAPYNVFHVLQSFHQPSVFYTSYQPLDSAGRLITSHLREQHEKVHNDVSLFTNIASSEINDQGQAKYDFNFAWCPSDGFLTQINLSLSSQLILSSIPVFCPFEQETNQLHQILHNASEAGLLTFLDPNIRPALNPPSEVIRPMFESYLPDVTILKMSTDDLAYLYPEQSIEEVAFQLAKQVTSFFLTQGADGSTLYWFEDGQLQKLHRPAPPVTVVDTIGAGDAYLAALATFFRRHSRLTPLNRPRCLEYCNQVAAEVCGVAGPNAPLNQNYVFPMLRRIRSRDGFKGRKPKET
jgi:sugar/nucleoside kinase (ribokinase family)